MHAARAPAGAPPAFTGEHVPMSPITLHAAHWSVHAALQQTPSTQKPLRHWLFAVHGLAGGSIATHLPWALQSSPLMQSASFTQAARHCAPPHRYGVHVLV